jgi:hypothetical protein
VAILKQIWVATKTREESHSGSNSRLAFVINENGLDMVHRDLPRRLIGGPLAPHVLGQQRGEATLHEFDVAAAQIRPENLTPSSVRIETRGGDRWSPHVCAIWGEAQISEFSDELGVVPVALGHALGDLSTDRSEGVVSQPLRDRGRLDPNSRLGLFLAVATTLDQENAGTDDDVRIVVSFQGGLIQQNLSLQGQLHRGQTALTFPDIEVVTPGAPEPTLANLDGVTIRIEGRNRWRPGSLFVLALRTLALGPTPWVPLVHIPHWDLGPLSGEPGEGQQSITLPLVTLST